MLEQKRHTKQDNDDLANLSLAFFACPDSDCADFNRFDADNLSVAEWMGKDKAIRRAILYNLWHTIQRTTRLTYAIYEAAERRMKLRLRIVPSLPLKSVLLLRGHYGFQPLVWQDKF